MKQIKTSDLYFCVNQLSGATLAIVGPTKSMLPTFDVGHHVVYITNFTEDDVQVGDIVIFEDKDKDWVVHRVVNKGYDEDGFYIDVRGDNIVISDNPLRRKDIIGIVVAVIY